MKWGKKVLVVLVILVMCLVGFPNLGTESEGKTLPNGTLSPDVSASNLSVSYNKQNTYNLAGWSNYSPLRSLTAVATQSDLIVQNLVVSPNSGPVGSNVTVSFTIRNQGNG